MRRKLVEGVSIQIDKAAKKEKKKLGYHQEVKHSSTLHLKIYFIRSIEGMISKSQEDMGSVGGYTA